MKKVFIFLLCWPLISFALTPIPAGKVQSAIGPNGWLNSVPAGEKVGMMMYRDLPQVA